MPIDEPQLRTDLSVRLDRVTHCPKCGSHAGYTSKGTWIVARGGRSKLEKYAYSSCWDCEPQVRLQKYGEAQRRLVS